jgi:hypothetical protein
MATPTFRKFSLTDKIPREATPHAMEIIEKNFENLFRRIQALSDQIANAIGDVEAQIPSPNSLLQSLVFDQPPRQIFDEDPILYGEMCRLQRSLFDILDHVEWRDMAYADLTFTANNGATWTVDSGDLAYYKYARVGMKGFVKGAIINTDVTVAGPTELRLTAPTGWTFGTNDSFGFNVYTDATGFATQDTGQSISRVSTNLLTMKKRDGTAWTITAGDNTGVIWNMVCELVAG